MSTTIAAAPPHGGRRNPRRGRPADDLIRYVQVLTGRFAGHRPGADPGRCRCGGTRPCPEEQQIAYLLELAGDARR
ncbi:MAG: hypothetical protein ACRDNF_09595 [Streptosporangiaceae bacterium]